MNQLPEIYLEDIIESLPFKGSLMRGVCRHWNSVFIKTQLRYAAHKQLILENKHRLSLVRSLNIKIGDELAELIFPNLRVFKMTYAGALGFDNIIKFLKNHPFINKLDIPYFYDRSVKVQEVKFINQLAELLPNMTKLREFSFYDYRSDHSTLINSLPKRKLKNLILMLENNTKPAIRHLSSNFNYLESLLLDIESTSTINLQFTLSQPFPHLKKLSLYVYKLSSPLDYKLESKNFPNLREILYRTDDQASPLIVNTNYPNKWPNLKLGINNFQSDLVNQLKYLDCEKSIGYSFQYGDDVSLVTNCLYFLTNITKICIISNTSFEVLDFNIFIPGFKKLIHLTELKLSGLRDDELFNETFNFSLKNLYLKFTPFEKAYCYATNYILFNCPRLEFLTLRGRLSDLPNVNFTKINLLRLKTLENFSISYNEDLFVKLISHLPSLLLLCTFPPTLKPKIQKKMPQVFVSNFCLKTSIHYMELDQLLPNSDYDIDSDSSF